MPNQKILSTLLTLLCITGLIVLYQASPDGGTFVSAAGESWLSGYDFRKSITITNSGSSLTDFQIKVDVTYDSDMQTDFDDIRFTASDGSTELSYWLESKTDSTSATFWIKVPSIPTGDSTIYMYYGNVSVSSASNGDDTFIFFDDFNSLDGWTASVNLSPLYEISTVDGVSAVHLKSDAHNESVQLFSDSTYSGDMVMESRVKHVSFSSSDSYFHLGTYIDSSNYSEWSFQKYYNRYNLGIKIAGVSASVTGSSTSVPSGWYNYEHIFDKNTPNFELLRGGVSKISTSPAGYSSSAYSLYMRVNQWNSGTSEHYVDWVFGRKHTSADPVYIMGVEESGAADLPVISGVEEVVYFTTADINVTIDDGGAPTDISISGDVPTQTLEDKSSGTYTFNLTSLTPGQTYSYTITATNSTGSDINSDTLEVANYAKKRPITITNSGSSLTDFQIKVDVTYDSDMQTDFDDIRFTASDGSTELSYWLESKTDSTSATFWIKVPSIPTGDSTIYMYYGNVSVSSASNGDNTFIFFDDFNSLDGWTVSLIALTPLYEITTVDGVSAVHLKTDQHSEKIRLMSNNTYSGGDMVMESRVKHASFSSSDSYFTLGTKIDDNNYYQWTFTKYYSRYDLGIKIAGVSASVNGSSTSVPSGWYNYSQILDTDTPNLELLRDDVSKLNTSPVGYPSSDYNLLTYVAQYNSGTSDHYIDWLFGRKYTATDPTTVVGEEIEESTGGCGAHNVWGWAYSSTVGPISFSCKNCDQDENGYTDVACGGDNSSTTAYDYGIDINTETGEFSGYAWSGAVGTISFNSSEIGTFPTTPSYVAKLNLETGEITGWARAIIACDWNGSACTTDGAGTNMGGWDGWIKFSGDLYGVSVIDGETYGEFSGSAWGGYVPGTNNSVLGEIRFSGLTNSNIQVYTSILLDANVAPVANFHVENSGNSYCEGETTSCSAYTKYSQLMNDSTDANGIGDIVHTYWYMRPSGVGEYSLLSSADGRTNYTMQLSDFTSGTGAYDVKLIVEDSGALTSEKVKTIDFQSSLEVDYSCCVGECTEDSAFKDCSLDEFSEIIEGSTLYFRDNATVVNYSTPSAGSSIQTRTWTNATKDDDYNAHVFMSEGKTVILEASDTIMSGTKSYTFGTISNPDFHELPFEYDVPQ